MKCKRKLGPTDIKYKSICAGSGFDIGVGKQIVQNKVKGFLI